MAAPSQSPQPAEGIDIFDNRIFDNRFCCGQATDVLPRQTIRHGTGPADQSPAVFDDPSYSASARLACTAHVSYGSRLNSTDGKISPEQYYWAIFTVTNITTSVLANDNQEPSE